MAISQPNEKSALLEKGSKPSSNKFPSSPSCKCGKVSDFLSKITVEPVLFCFIMSYSLESVFITNMLIDKTCELQLNYSKEVCDNIDSGHYDDQEDAVQRITNKYNMYCMWAEYGPAIFVMIIMGAWSDTKGRKLPLLLPALGATLKAFILLANGYFWSWPPYFTIFSYIPAGLGGSMMGVFMAAYAYVSEDSGNQSRTTRLSFASVVMYAGSPIGHAMSTVLFMHGGYIFVFGANAILSSLTVVYILIRFKSSPRKDNQCEDNRAPTQKKLTFNTIKSSVAVVIKPREGKQRAHIIGHIICIWITLASYEGMSFLFLYTRKKFGWNYYTYNILSIVNTPISIATSCILVPILSYRFQLEDSMLGFIGSCSHIFFGIITGTAPYGWVLYVGLVVSSSSGIVTASSRGAISKLVPPNELGGSFSVVALGEAFMPIVIKPIFTLTYNSTLETFPGTIFIIGSAIGVVACCIYTWMLTHESNTLKLPQP